MSLIIDGQVYRAWREGSFWFVESPAGVQYRITPDLVCNCPDSQYRRHLCKHARAVAEMAKDLTLPFGKG